VAAGLGDAALLPVDAMGSDVKIGVAVDEDFDEQFIDAVGKAGVGDGGRVVHGGRRWVEDDGSWSGDEARW